MTEHRLNQLRELTQRSTEYAMHGGCTDYYCDCHDALPECITEIARLREWAAQDRVEALALIHSCIAEVALQTRGMVEDYQRAAGMVMESLEATADALRDLWKQRDQIRAKQSTEDRTHPA